MGKRRRILFVCIGNTCRSQMAEGFALALSDGTIEARSAGLSACGSVNGPTMEAMAEKGIDISRHTSDQLTPEMLDWADIVVSMGGVPCEQFCHGFNVIKYDWNVPDPLGKPWAFMRSVRDGIEAKVKELINETV